VPHLNFKENMPSSVDLTALFEAVLAALTQERDSLNRADDSNQDHGDHMVEIFKIAVRAASEKRGADLADAMQYASEQLRLLQGNGSAQVYARGLSLLAEQSSRQVRLEELVPYVQAYLHPAREQTHLQPEETVEEERSKARSAEILKGMLSALADWERAEAGQAEATGSLDMGYLFGVGMAYLQAKQRGGDRTQILAETVVSASPLGRLPHRHRSGMLVVTSLLQAMG
jgi:hypothetical protein